MPKQIEMEAGNMAGPAAQGGPTQQAGPAHFRGKAYQVPGAGNGGGSDGQAAGGSKPGGGSGGGSTGGSGGQQGPGPVPPTPAVMGDSQMGSHYQGPIGYSGGVIGDAMWKAGQSFSDPSRLQGALPFWQSPGIQVAAQHGYDPGQQFAGQQVTGQSLQNDPLIAAELSNFNQNVLPGIQDQFNTMGLGRSTAAGNAMAKAQAGMMVPLYQQAADLENQAINRQTQQGQFSAGLSQQDLSRLQGATESELGRRTQSAQEQAAAQQQLFQDMMQMQGSQFSQGQQGAQQIFDMGQQAQQTGQNANQAAYQDFIRRMGLSEEAINPFGGIQGLLGTTTSGK